MPGLCHVGSRCPGNGHSTGTGPRHRRTRPRGETLRKRLDASGRRPPRRRARTPRHASLRAQVHDLPQCCPPGPAAPGSAAWVSRSHARAAPVPAYSPHLLQARSVAPLHKAAPGALDTRSRPARRPGQVSRPRRTPAPVAPGAHCSAVPASSAAAAPLRTVPGSRAR